MRAAAGSKPSGAAVPPAFVTAGAVVADAVGAAVAGAGAVVAQPVSSAVAVAKSNTNETVHPIVSCRIQTPRQYAAACNSSLLYHAGVRIENDAQIDSAASRCYDRLETPAFTVAAGKFDHMIALRGEKLEAVPIADAISRLKRVPLDGDLVRAARSVGICLGD
jgi:hypothetical protein